MVWWHAGVVAWQRRVAGTSGHLGQAVVMARHCVELLLPEPGVGVCHLQVAWLGALAGYWGGKGLVSK